MNENNNQIKTKQDAEKAIEKLLEKRNQIIEQGPQLHLAIKPYHLDALFEKDGTPKYDFRVSDGQKRKIARAFKHPHVDQESKLYFGDLGVTDIGKRTPNFYPVVYVIKINPLFLTDDELLFLGKSCDLKKDFEQTDVTFFAPCISYTHIPSYKSGEFASFRTKVNVYRKNIPEFRALIQQIDSAIKELQALKLKLPMGEEVDMQDEAGFSM